MWEVLGSIFNIKRNNNNNTNQPIPNKTNKKPYLSSGEKKYSSI
jgi:hypothetical protein